MRKVIEGAEGEIISWDSAETLYNQYFKDLETLWYGAERKLQSEKSIRTGRLIPYLFALARIRTADYAKMQNNDGSETGSKVEKQLSKGSDFHVLKDYYDRCFFNEEFENASQTARENAFKSAIEDLSEYKDIFSALIKEIGSIKERQLHNKKFIEKLEQDELDEIQEWIRRFSSFKIDETSRPYIMLLFHQISRNKLTFKMELIF